jgi:hypothetical protein
MFLENLLSTLYVLFDQIIHCLFFFAQELKLATTCVPFDPGFSLNKLDYNQGNTAVRYLSFLFNKHDRSLTFHVIPRFITFHHVIPRNITFHVIPRFNIHIFI